MPKDVGLSLLFYPTASLADPALMHPQKRRCWADGLLLLLDILGPGGLSMHPLSSAAPGEAGRRAGEAQKGLPGSHSKDQSRTPKLPGSLGRRNVPP